MAVIRRIVFREEILCENCADLPSLTTSLIGVRCPIANEEVDEFLKCIGCDH